MAWNLAFATRNATGDALMGVLNTGGTATLEIREGTSPGADEVATGTLLATLTFSATAWSTFVLGTAAANSITSDTNIDTTGTAGYARLLNGDGSTHSDMDIGEGSGTLSFDDIDFISGGTASITSMNVTIPAQ